MDVRSDAQALLLATAILIQSGHQSLYLVVGFESEFFRLISTVARMRLISLFPGKLLWQAILRGRNVTNRTKALSRLIPAEAIPPRTLISRRAFGAGMGAMALVASTTGRSQPAQPERKLGVALVGLGGYSTGELAPALRETRSCYLAGVVTGSPDKGRRWAREFRFPERNIFSYATMAELRNAADIDIVYVVTPNALHARHAIAAAQAGKHVISEKPFTTTVSDAEAVIAACLDAKVKLSIGYRLHFDPYYRELMRLARERDFGDFTLASGEHARDAKGTEGWRLSKTMGGGPLRDLGIYVIQAACMAAGEVSPVSVTAQQGPTTRPYIFTEVEESMRWTMTFANGFVCDCTTSYRIWGKD